VAADIGSAQRSACRQIAERRQQTGMAGHAINSLSGEMAMRRSKGLPKDMEKWDDEQIAEFWERHNSADSETEAQKTGRQGIMKFMAHSKRVCRHC